MAAKNIEIQKMAIAVLFTGLYFTLTIALAPISYLPFQVRISDVLIVMSVVVGLPAVYGVFFGCILANLFPVGYPPNPIDIVAGSLANLLASYAAYRIAYQRSGKLRIVIAAFTSTLIVSLIVGSYLPFIIMPKVSWRDIFWVGYLGVLPGEVVSQMALGIPAIMTIRKLIHMKSMNT
ncbi:MAG: QueT transporter family protein [Nitrososphaeria archaeon]|nr:QueT transporter family protein [Nitrososphaeria archaeon]